MIVKSDKGFTLIEMMIALLILAISLLGFFAAITASIDSNLRNEIRNTGVGLTTQVVETLIAQDFDALVAGTCIMDPADPTPGCLVPNATFYPSPTATIRSGYLQDYAFTWTISDLNIDLKQIEINLSYTYRGDDLDYDSVIYKHRSL